MPCLHFYCSLFIPFYSVLYFQGPRWKKLWLKFRLLGESQYILVEGKSNNWGRGLLGERWTEGLEDTMNGLEVRIVLFDISKAFDKV